VASWQIASRALTASKSLPIEEVNGVLMPRSTIVRTCITSEGQNSPRGSSSSAQCVEIGHGDAPRLPDGGIAAGQRQILEVCRTLKAAVIADKPLTSPDLAVLAVACAVKRDADHRPLVRGPPVLRETRGDVRLVVLDAIGYR
jgi:hypothetical protein